VAPRRQQCGTPVDQPHEPWKSAAFSLYPRGSVMGRSIRTERYGFTARKNRQTGQVPATELYDDQADRAENENVASLRENAELVSQLLK
jgi:iduronate 2-sulfatase